MVHFSRMRNVGTVNFPSGKPQPAPYLSSADLPGLRSAGFQTCCVAGFQAGSPALWPAGLETRDAADLAVCATLNSYPAPAGPGRAGGTAKNPLKPPFGTFTNEGK
jgi:hypothetical protein